MDVGADDRTGVAVIQDGKIIWTSRDEAEARWALTAFGFLDEPKEEKQR
jgi:hypothetical protein